MTEHGAPDSGHRATTAPAKISAIIGFLVFGELASGFVQGYYSPLIPSIAHRLSVSDADITWFVTVQTLSAAVCVPLLSKLGDMFGHRRMLRLAMIAVLVGALIIALVPSYPVMLVARLLHGPIAVWLPLEIAIIHGRISGKSAQKAIGMLVGCLTGGVIVGTLVAGLVDSVSPSLAITLLVPVLPLLVALYAVYFRIPETPFRTPGRIDTVGFAGLAIVMITALSGLSLAASSGIGAPATLLTLAVAVIALALWIVWERRSSAPAIDLRLVASRQAAPLHLAGFLFGLVMFGTQAPLTTFLSSNPAKTGYGFSATSGRISLVIAAIGLLATIGAIVFAHVAHRWSARGTLIIAAVVALIANVFVAVCHTAMWQIWVYAIISGLGMGMLLGGLPAVLAEQMPKGQTGESVGVYNSLRALGGAAGGALFAVVLSLATSAGSDHADLRGYVVMWAMCAVAFAVCAVGLSMLRPRQESVRPEASLDAEIPYRTSTVGESR